MNCFKGILHEAAGEFALWAVKEGHINLKRRNDV